MCGMPGIHSTACHGIHSNAKRRKEGSDAPPVGSACSPVVAPCQQSPSAFSIFNPDSALTITIRTLNTLTLYNDIRTCDAAYTVPRDGPLWALPSGAILSTTTTTDVHRSCLGQVWWVLGLGILALAFNYDELGIRQKSGRRRFVHCT